MQRKALVIYEPIGWLAADELELLKKLKIESSLYHNKDVHYSESKQQKWIGKLEDKLPEGRGIFIVTDTRRVVIVCEARGGQKDGQAKVYSEDGSYYTVQFRRDDCDGTADYFSANGQKILTANFAHDKLVEMRFAKSGEVYIGEHFYLVRHGRGKQFKNDSQTMDSIVYNGIFENDKFIRGYARLDYYVGDLEDGVYEGQGTLYYDRDHSRKLMSGTFRNGKLDGYGQEFYENEENDLKYEGQFVDGIYEGDGSLVVLEPEKKIYQGKFKNGEPTMKFDILDEKRRVFQKVTYKNGKIIEIREEFFYNVKMASTKEIQDEEINSGNIEMQVMEKVCYARQLSSVRFYRNLKDENPAYIMQVDPKLFNIKYEGIINESGSLIYSGDMKHILFEGKGILRYAIKNEPRKYFGSFANGLFDGQGELYLSNNQLLYVGSFKKNSFHGMGKLTIHSIHLTGNTEPSPKELKVGHFPPERFDVEADGEYANGKFVSGIWRYTGLSDRVHDKLLTMKVENRTDPLFGKMYDKKTLLYEGTFAHYCFHGKGTLYYKDGVQKKYVGGFKLGCFEDFGQLYDLKGKLIYEGGFTNGIYDGVGKLYQGLEEDLIYEGELKKGKLTGKGKMLEKDGKRLRSEGTYENGVLVEGFVKIYSQQEPGKLVYEGMVKDGAYSGKGVLYNSSGEQSIQGVFGKGELLEGVKKEYHNDGSLKREGSVQNGQFEGHVKEYYYDGKIMFEGQYERGERNGKGIMYHRNGQPKQTGIFKDHVFYDGDAFYYFEDNVTKMFVGKIKNMYYNGPGVRYYENGFLEYEGDFKNGLYDGEGVYYYYEEPGKIKFKGRFGDGRPDGEGEYYGLNGQLIYKGKMINWKKEGKGVMYSSTGEKLLEGTFDDDRLYNGRGKILWPGFGTVKYEGEFQGGYQEGPGKSYFTNGNLEYEGAYKGNYFEGAGILYSEHEKGVKIYEGKFIKGRYHGTGYLDYKGEIYEGEFKNGKKHGDGIWKYKDPKLGLIFEGRFEADEMIDGYARIRDANKTLLFEGEIRKSKYEGKATKYYKSGKKEYEGNFKAGFFDGFGVKYTESGEKEYEGEYIRGVITGDGKIYKNGIVIYDGRTLKGVYHGFGTLYDDDGNLVYKGPFNNGEFEGRGILYHPKTNQIKYEGDFVKSVFEGYGEKHSKKGYFKYAGGFRQGKFHGEGALYFPDGKTKKYVGTFNMKVFDGVGKLYTQDGKKIYEGDFLNGIYHGNGILYYQEDKNLAYYEGEFENGLPHGNGTFRYEDGTLQYKGEVKNGAYHGKGTYYYTDGKVKANGSFINGKYNAP